MALSSDLTTKLAGFLTDLWAGTLGVLHAITSVTVSAAGGVIFGVYGKVKAAADGVFTLLDNAGTAFTRLQFGGTTSSYPALRRSSAILDVVLADSSGYATLRANVVQAQDYVEAVGAQITVGTGTGVTVNATGRLVRQVYKVTLAKEAFVTAGTTSDVTIATLPAKTRLLGAIADLTATFTLGADTLAMVLGRGSGGAEFLASFDAKTATGQFGDTNDAELGTELVRAVAVSGGTLGSWSTTTTVVLRLTSSATNIGTGTATSLTTGSVTVYLVTERMP